MNQVLDWILIHTSECSALTGTCVGYQFTIAKRRPD